MADPPPPWVLTSFVHGPLSENARFVRQMAPQQDYCRIFADRAPQTEETERDRVIFLWENASEVSKWQTGHIVAAQETGIWVSVIMGAHQRRITTELDYSNQLKGVAVLLCTAKAKPDRKFSQPWMSLLNKLCKRLLPGCVIMTQKNRQLLKYPTEIPVRKIGWSLTLTRSSFYFPREMSSLQDTQKGRADRGIGNWSVCLSGARNLLFGIPRVCNSDPAEDRIHCTVVLGGFWVT